MFWRDRHNSMTNHLNNFPPVWEPTEGTSKCVSKWKRQWHAWTLVCVLLVCKWLWQESSAINLNQYVSIKTGSCSPPPSRTYSHLQACGPSELQSWDWCAGLGDPLSFSLGKRPGGSLDEGRQGPCQSKAGSSSLLLRGWGHLPYVFQWKWSLLPKMCVYPVCSQWRRGLSTSGEASWKKSLILNGSPHPVFPSKASLGLRDQPCQSMLRASHSVAFWSQHQPVLLKSSEWGIKPAPNRKEKSETKSKCGAKIGRPNAVQSPLGM